MKKLLAALLILSVLFLSLPAAIAEEPTETTEPEVFTSGDYSYILLEDGTVEITKYTGEADTLEIPDAIDGKKVSGIGDEAFRSCSDLTEITIPNSVTSIGDHAFSSCSGMTSVTIPESVEKTGSNPFRACKNLTVINISPDHPYLATIDGVLFSKLDKRLVCYPKALKENEYTVPQGIRIIGDWAFSDCTSLTSVTLTDSVTSIGEAAFNNCTSLTEITIPDSVTSIGDYAFFWCKSLTSVTIPDSVTSIGDSAFSDCESLTATVSRDSYAAQYCKDNNINYTYPDANDWLND